MTIYSFYSQALKSHNETTSKVISNGIHTINSKDFLKLPTINELSGSKGVFTWSSLKKSIRIRSIYTSFNRNVITMFSIHDNPIFAHSFEKGYTIILGKSKQYLSQMTKRHINYLLGLLDIPAKYVTINNEPYLLKNDGSRVALELDSHFDLSNL